MVADSSLGVRLMELRKRKGMSMRELAEQSGTSTSLISQIETGRTNPTVSKLQNLATALGVPVNYFFDPHGPSLAETQPSTNGTPLHSGVPPELIRRADRSIITLDDGVAWERLTPHGRSGIEFLMVTYEVGTGSGPLASHYGEEFVLVMSGRLEVTFAFDTVELTEGDSLVIDSTVPHAVRNVGDVAVSALWVNWTRRDE
jgi:transcriptional regulator with XRE-family HTH domain